MYESLKKQIPGDDEPSLFWKLGCGGVAGLVGQTCTYPLDVIRRQMQVCMPMWGSPLNCCTICVGQAGSFVSEEASVCLVRYKVQVRQELDW